MIWFATLAALNPDGSVQQSSTGSVQPGNSICIDSADDPGGHVQRDPGTGGRSVVLSAREFNPNTDVNMDGPGAPPQILGPVYDASQPLSEQ